MLSVPVFKEGDVIGIGVTLPRFQLFITMNGELVKDALTLPRTNLLYPAITLINNEDQLLVNFEASRMMYDVSSRINNELYSIIREIHAIKINKNNVNKIIQEYLYLNGCSKTLSSFERDNKMDRLELMSKITLN